MGFYILCDQKSFLLYSTVSVQKNTYTVMCGIYLIWEYSETSENGLLLPLNNYLGSDLMSKLSFVLSVDIYNVQR